VLTGYAAHPAITSMGIGSTRHRYLGKQGKGPGGI